jgi:hypothetical protein
MKDWRSYNSSSPVAYFFLFLIVGVESKLGPLGTLATSGLLYLPEWLWGWRIWWKKIGRRNRSTRRKSAPAPLRSPQIPLDQTRVQTQDAAVGSQQLAAWAMAQPSSSITKVLNLFICVRHYAFVAVIHNFSRLQAIQILKRTPYILDFIKQLHNVMCVNVTIDRFWIDDWIYWTLWYSMWLHFTIRYYTHAR